jgi:histone-lysine N-methyltransferase SETMAR
VDLLTLSRFASVSRVSAEAAQAAILLRCSDLSLGREHTPVRCENLSGSGPPFPDVEYLCRCVGDTPLSRRRLRFASTPGCTCSCTVDAAGTTFTCVNGECCCSHGHPPYDGERRLRSLLPQADSGHGAAPPAVIIECSDHCLCHPDRCATRVVGRGVRAHLTVFLSSDRGWALRTDDSLRRGEFVCEYAGELISNAQLAARRLSESASNHYLMSVVEHPRGGNGRAMQTNIDPRERGGAGRYINHSCDPNLAPQLVRVGSFVPSVAFFCARDIAAGEELTFHYGATGHRNARGSVESTWEQEVSSPVPLRRRPCRCGAPCCEGLLPFDPCAD